ncbi:MAG: fluoride efflux transporter CrcB [Planctomycetota bacterium]
MLKVALIFLGGGIGSILRYLAGGWVQGSLSKFSGLRAWTLFPAGTMLVNILGCLVIGFLATAFSGHWRTVVPEEYRIGILTGVLGGFTTFSSFAWEGSSLARDNQYLQAAVYVLASVAVGLLAAWAGNRLAVWVFGLPAPVLGN